VREQPSHGSNLGASRPDTGNTGRSARSGRSGEEDWDVEAAVEERVVQVMFTVPRARLRVVNADVERESLVDDGEGEGGLEVTGVNGRDKRKGRASDAQEGDNRYDGSGWS